VTDADPTAEVPQVDRVCLLHGKPDLWWFEEAALERVDAGTDASIDLVIRTDGADVAPDPKDYPFDAEVMAVDPVRVGDRIDLPERALAPLRECDLAIQSEVGILTGAVLTAPTHGVVSYHHGDLRRYRGVIVHLWNYLDRVETGGVTVQRLTEELDAGEILAETSVRLGDAVTWSEVESRKHAAGVPLLAEAIRNIEDPTVEPTRLDDDDLGHMYRREDVTPTVVARYLALETALTIRSRGGKLRYLTGLLTDST
jgi:hypothetical protein